MSNKKEETVDVSPMPKRKRTSGKKRKRREDAEQVVVICKKAPSRHADLHDHMGVLTVDTEPGETQPHTVTFDPADESVDNAIITVYGHMRGDSTIAVLDADGRWAFEVQKLDG